VEICLPRWHHRHLLPLRDLQRMSPKLAGQLALRLVSPERRQQHLRLELGAVPPSPRAGVRTGAKRGFLIDPANR
jgi:hypothetical protein